MKTLTIITAGIALIAALGCSAQAIDYPQRPVRIIVPFAPGGAVDVIARIIAQKLSERPGSQFYVENVAGAGGDIGARAAVRAAPDGQTLLVATAPDLVVRSLIRANPPYDPVASFAPITLVATTPAMITVHPSVSAKSMMALIDLLKANPGKYSYGTPGYGTIPHLDGERLFRQTFGLDVVHVPFQGAGPAVASSVAGQTAILGAPLPLVAPYVKDGTLRALAIASNARSADFPDVPTLAEAGIANQVGGATVGAYAPAKTPKNIIELLHSRLVAIVSLPEVRARLTTLGFEPVATTPKEFATWINAEHSKWSEVVRASNIRID